MAISKDKLLAFEYVLYKLTNWYMNKNNISNYNDFNSNNNLNKLKVIKLHFFVTAVNSQKNNLLNVFDKFYAMPYGHVESDVYNSLDKLNLFKIDTKKLFIISENNLGLNNFVNLKENIRTEIDNSIELLESKNPDIINYNALDLVEISHSWFSWISMFNYAKVNNRNSELIPHKLILEENKNFELVF